MDNQWIAMYSATHEKQNWDQKYKYYKYLGLNGEEVLCTAVFIRERYKGDINNHEEIKQYMIDERRYLYSDMEFKGVVTKWLASY